MEYSFDQLGSVILAVFPPRILPNPRLLVTCKCWRDSADSVPVLLSFSQNTDCYLHLSSHQCKALRGLLQGKELHLSWTQYIFRWEITPLAQACGSWQEASVSLRRHRKTPRMQTLLKHNLEWIYTQPEKNATNGIELKVVFSLMCFTFLFFRFFFFSSL